ncbi:MAG: Abi family protein, partial [Victivallaceae bacterium]|nr:Abi family protein [Victivallaceae bacterium]
ERKTERKTERNENKYDEENDLLLWMVSEVMTFGNMLSMFSGLEKYLQIQLAAEFKIPSIMLK